MSSTPRTRTFSLQAEEIDGFSDWLESIQSQLKIERHNRIRVRLQMEDILLRMRSKLGSDAVCTATCEIRFGRPRLCIEVAGEPYNPLSEIDSELGNWETSLSTSIGLTPQYNYDAGTNVIRMRLPHNSMNPVARIAIALLLGAAVGFVGAVLIPSSMRSGMVQVLLIPSYNMWNRLLNAISGPIIFLTVVTTMMNTQRITERGGSSSLIVMRYFVLSFVIVAGSLFCLRPLFVLVRSELSFSLELLYSLLDNLLYVVPSNVFDPFVESNTSQLLFIALVLGFMLRKLGSKVNYLSRLVRQSNLVGLEVANGVSWLVPIFCALFLCLELWSVRDHSPLELWLPLALSLVASLVTMAISLAIVCRMLRVKPLVLIKKMWGPFSLALRTGSLDDSLSKTQESCVAQLGINKDYVKAGLPQGLVLYMPISAVGTIIFTLFVAHMYSVQSNSLWYVSAIIMAVVVFVATPPVPGANLLAYVVLFSTLGIPDDALLDAMIFDIVFGIFAGAANQAMLQLEMLIQSNRLGLLNTATLKESA